MDASALVEAKRQFAPIKRRLAELPLQASKAERTELVYLMHPMHFRQGSTRMKLQEGPAQTGHVASDIYLSLPEQQENRGWHLQLFGRNYGDEFRQSHSACCVMIGLWVGAAACFVMFVFAVERRKSWS